MASSSGQTSSSTQNCRRPSCNRLNDNVFELYKPSAGPVNVEIVFFHGFQVEACEDAYLQTWMQGDGSACWLNTWLPDRFPQARIFSVSYDSSTQTSSSKGRVDMYLIGESLVHSLIGLVGIGQKCPVVLVGHCVGGLVLKEICLRADEFRLHKESAGRPHRYRYQKFLKNVKAIFFYATAHLGSDILWISESNQRGPLLEYFQSLNSQAARINAQFARLRQEHGWKTFGVNEANETHTSALVPFLDHASLSELELEHSSKSSLVAKEGSSRVDVDYFSTIAGVDHFTICRPKDQSSNSFLILVRFVEEICEEEEGKNKHLRRDLHLPRKLMHKDARMEDIHKLLDLQNPQAIRLVLVGMDGIGKSTLAKQILLGLQHEFEYVCFVELEDAPHNLRWRDFERLMAENLYEGSGRKVPLSELEEAPWFFMGGKKLLVIVDDVGSEHVRLMRQLLDHSNDFGEGSRLIITSCIRDLVQGFVEYDFPFLSSEESHELLEAYVEVDVLRVIPKKLVAEIVDECDGLPLLLEMIGSYLCNKVDVNVWKGSVSRLRTPSSLKGVGENQLWSKLRVTFDGLQKPEQAIFLDLATFDLFGREKKQYDWEILKTAWKTGLGPDEGFLTDMAILNLRDRLFLRIIPYARSDGRIKHTGIGSSFHVGCTFYIHKALRNMGKWLSRPPNSTGLELESCSRIWQLEDAMHLLNESKTGTSRAQNINTSLEVLDLSLPTKLKASSLSSPNLIKWSSVGNFEGLRMLRMSNVNMQMNASDEWILPRSLAMLHMVACSGPRCPKWWWQSRTEWPIRFENVEALGRMSVLLLEKCGAVHLPQNFHRLKSLRILEINVHDDGTNEMQLPNTFGLLPALEVLSLDAPVNKLPDSLLELSSLRSMKISNSMLLKVWPKPNSVSASSFLPSLTRLELANLPALAELPDSFGGMSSLQVLTLKGCSALKLLPESFGELHQLTSLDIWNCGSLESLCKSFPSLHSLEDLVLGDLVALRQLPNQFGHLASLRVLEIYGCEALRELPESFVEIQSLISLNIVDCHGLDSLWKDSEQLGLHWKPMRSLKYMRLEGVPRLRGLPESLGQCSALRQMTLRYIPQLQLLPESLGQCSAL